MKVAGGHAKNWNKTLFFFFHFGMASGRLQDSGLKDKGDASNSLHADAVASLSHRCPVQDAGDEASLECEEAHFVQKTARSRPSVESPM